MDRETMQRTESLLNQAYQILDSKSPNDIGELRRLKILIRCCLGDLTVLYGSVCQKLGEVTQLTSFDSGTTGGTSHRP